MKRPPINPSLLPPLPAKMAAPDPEAIRQLALYVQTTYGREQAHAVADYYEQLLGINEHNAKVAGDALRMLREALEEVAA